VKNWWNHPCSFWVGNLVVCLPVSSPRIKALKIRIKVGFW
jgi:hypothetical protein